METAIGQINSIQRSQSNKWLWELGRVPHKQGSDVNLAVLRGEGAVGN